MREGLFAGVGKSGMEGSWATGCGISFLSLNWLGRSATSENYGVRGLDEARVYLVDPVLGEHLIMLCVLLLTLETSDSEEVMNRLDDWKLRSSMMLFAEASDFPGAGDATGRESSP